MKILFCAILLSVTVDSQAKMELTKEIKRGPITKDACGSFDDGVKALERLQDTSSFDSDGQIALYNFSARALAALYKQKMLQEKNKNKRAYYKGQFELACRNAG